MKRAMLIVAAGSTLVAAGIGCGGRWMVWNAKPAAQSGWIGTSMRTGGAPRQTPAGNYLLRQSGLPSAFQNRWLL